MKEQTPKSDIPPNIAPKVVTPENHIQIWDSSATLIGQLAIVTLFGAILGGIPLSGLYPKIYINTPNFLRSGIAYNIPTAVPASSTYLSLTDDLADLDDLTRDGPSTHLSR